MMPPHATYLSGAASSLPQVGQPISARRAPSPDDALPACCLWVKQATNIRTKIAMPPTTSPTPTGPITHSMRPRLTLESSWGADRFRRLGLDRPANQFLNEL